MQTGAVLPLFGSGLLGLAGCRQSTGVDAQEVEKHTEGAASRPTVPLRVWLVGRLQSSEALQRHWHSFSEQPIKLRSMTSEQFFEEQSCPADLLVFPSRCLGELIQRQWITRLPTVLLKPSSEFRESKSKGTVELTDQLWQDQEDVLPITPAAMIEATSYDGTRYGFPLGFGLVSVLGGSQVDVPSLSWEQLAQKISRTDAPPTEPNLLEIDSDALVDRFLAIAIGHSSMNTKYGVLFDLRTLKSRLMEPEFQFAAELLKTMAAQSEDAAISVVGSHTRAWQWLHQAGNRAFALVSMTEVDWDSRELDGPKLIDFSNSRPWYSGAGLVVALASQCQQTSQSINFMRWLYSDRILQTLRTLTGGVAVFPASGSSPIEQFSQQNALILEDSRICYEPRMPGAHLYRKAVSESLVEMLAGKCSVNQALTAAADSLDRITSQRQLQQLDYERSLGLRL